MIDVRPLSLPDVLEIRPRRLGDSRGWFAETYNRRTLAEVGIDLEFVQDNRSLSVFAGTIRGLHFQKPPHAQDKLVTVLSGAVWDVAVDLRAESQTFGRHVGIELSAEIGNQVLIPKGFAHGFVTLRPQTEVLYKVTDFYSREHDAAVRWNDPTLGIEWPLNGMEPLLSEKDREAPRLSEIAATFLGSRLATTEWRQLR